MKNSSWEFQWYGTHNDDNTLTDYKGNILLVSLLKTMRAFLSVVHDQVQKKVTLYILTLVCTFSIQLSGYISHGADKENLSNNQELHYLVFISIILKTLTKDSAGILRR